MLKRRRAGNRTNHVNSSARFQLEGRLAAKAGQGEADCPYFEVNDYAQWRRNNWLIGFRAASEELKGMAAATE